jgi:hypothetical protein
MLTGFAHTSLQRLDVESRFTSSAITYESLSLIHRYTDLVTSPPPALRAIADINGDRLPDVVVDQVNSGIYLVTQPWSSTQVDGFPSGSKCRRGPKRVSNVLSSIRQIQRGRPVNLLAA